MILAKYIRLSSADEDAVYGDKPESNSVSNQRMLLDSYIQREAEFSGCPVLEFLDDGRSGTNFARPGVRALLDAAKRREIDCVIVKDFSRFGRNYIEVGNYLEQVFPFLGIRFISVNDGYDSRNYPYGVAGDLNNAIRNLINELYSRDLSEKVKGARRQYAQRGQCITAYPIYGYLKSPEDRKKLIPDDNAAEVVRRIFDRFLSGLSPTEIARELNSDGIPTPSQRKRALGSKRQTWNSERRDNEWTDTSITRILRDERYTGKLISIKSTRREVGNQNSSKATDKNDWIVVPDAFVPIVTQETFDAAQRRHSEIRRPVKARGPRKVNLFSGKVKCGSCGLALSRRKVEAGWYYSCDCKAQKEKGNCRSIRLFEKDLIHAVLSSIRLQAKLAIRVEKQSLRQEKNSNRVQDSVWEKRRRMQMKLDRLTAQKVEVYLRYDSEEITAVEFKRKRAEINQAIEECCAALSSAIKPDTNSWNKDGVGIKDQIHTLKGLTNLRSLDREIVEKLIHSIRVYAGNQVEIVWNFSDDYMKLLEKKEEDICNVGA